MRNTKRADRTRNYVSKAAEEPLDGGNPFKKVPADEPIPDADAAAVSAVLNRDKPPPIMGTLQPREKLDAGKIVLRNGNGEPASKNGKDTNGHTKAGTEKGGPGDGPRTVPLFRPKGPSAAEVGTEDVDGSDSDVRRIAKRARSDSRSLLVGPGDNAREEERKMRANLGRRAVVEEGEEGGGEAPDRQRDGGASGDTQDDDDVVVDDEQVGYTNLVEPTTTRKGLLRPQDQDRTSTRDVNGLDEVDERGDDDDVEAKRVDDYDVENYAEFEDDDDDTENLDPGERLV
ncbi:hypothetical protein VTG60DRAFT_46 [Thermothelomyces hinnuleus]